MLEEAHEVPYLTAEWMPLDSERERLFTLKISVPHPRARSKCT